MPSSNTSTGHSRPSRPTVARLCQRCTPPGLRAPQQPCLSPSKRRSTCTPPSPRTLACTTARPSPFDGVATRRARSSISSSVPKWISRLRRQRPQVHRDRPVDLGHLEPGRHHPGPRLLVLLRLRPPRRLDERGHPLHPGHRPPGRLVRRAGASPWWRRRSCAGASGPTSSSCSSWAWCSRSGPSPSPTPPRSAACSSRS